jgi:hypothetical protein
MKHIYTLLVVVAAGSQMGSTDCDGNVLRDPGFDLWCGESLCAWKIERGDIQRVPTWHEADAGVALLGGDTAIEQVSPVNSGDASCIRFDLVANIDENAEVDLNVDLEGDGTIEMTERLPTSHWKPLSYNILIDGPFDGVRFELAKHGDGSAVLAQIGATIVHDCDGLTPIRSGPRPNGAHCGAPEDCASGLCIVTPENNLFGFGSICVGCDPKGAACPGGDVCGVGQAGQPILEMPDTCVAAGSKLLGENCIADAECASAICNTGYCSTCSDTAPCPTNQFCGPSWHTAGPSLCDAGNRAGKPGDPCATNDDCGHQICRGTQRRQCSDGRPCNDQSDCPAESGLDPGMCTLVGIQGGSCE